jgi:hypothetical protein
MPLSNRSGAEPLQKHPQRRVQCPLSAQQLTGGTRPDPTQDVTRPSERSVRLSAQRCLSGSGDRASDAPGLQGALSLRHARRTCCTWATCLIAGGSQPGHLSLLNTTEWQLWFTGSGKLTPDAGLSSSSRPATRPRRIRSRVLFPLRQRSRACPGSCRRET